MHFSVAFFWSAVFIGIALTSGPVGRWLTTWAGTLTIAVVYGPLIWVVMSAAVIPGFTGRPLTLTPRWWIQLVGHMVFVGLPIVWGVGAARPEHHPSVQSHRL